MKALVKTSCIAAIALALTTFGASQAKAGWAVGGRVAVGVSVPCAPFVYCAPAYCAPAPVVRVGVAYCGPRVVAPYYHPYFRVGGGWGPRAAWGRPYGHR